MASHQEAVHEPPSQALTSEDEAALTSREGPTTAVAWILVLPVAALVLAVLGNLLPALVDDGVPATGLRFFEGMPLLPEAREQTGYLIALAFPVLCAVGAGLAAPRLARYVGARWSTTAVAAALTVQVVLAAFIAYCWGRQSVIEDYFPGWQTTIAIAVALTVVPLAFAPLAIRRPRILRHEGARWVTPACWAVAGLVTAAGLSFAVYDGGNIAAAPTVVHFHIPFTLDEFAAVAGGRAPLVDFTPQYVSLLPYLGIPVLAAWDGSILSFTLFMAALSAIALLAVFWTFRRLTGSWALGLALYVPFVSFALFPTIRAGEQTAFIANYFAVMPMRYFGPLVTMAFLANWLHAPRAWRLVALGTVAGFALINNLDFGLAAFGGALAAVACASAAAADRRRPATVALSLAVFLAGALVAILAFTGLTLAWSGRLPNPGLSLSFAQQFASAGFFMLPMPGPYGLHTIMFLTFAACAALAGGRALRGTERSPAATMSTGLLAFAGIFGCGASAYYVGRSHPQVLVMLFAAWSIALSVLAWELVRLFRGRDLARQARLLLLVPLALVVGHLALTATALGWTRAVEQQPERLATSTAPPIFEAAEMRRLMNDCTDLGEEVIVMYPLGHAIAESLGLENYFPFNHPSVVTYDQMDSVRAAVARHDVRKLFAGELLPEVRAELTRIGFIPRTQRGTSAPEPFVAISGGPAVTYWTRGTFPSTRSCR